MAPPASGASYAQPTVVGGYVEVDGVRFVLVSRLDDFMAEVGTQRRIGLRLNTLDYEETLSSLMGRFDSGYEQNTPEYRAFKYAALTCAGCGWEFPGSYTMGLLGMYGYSFVLGGTSGYAEFAKTGRCTRCGSEESVLFYERFASSDVGVEDLTAFSQYWRELGRQYWLANERQDGICDRCNDGMSQGEGSLVSGTNLQCASCMESYLADGLKELRANPYYYGATELRKARNFAAR